MLLTALLIGGYMVGSIPFGYLVARARGIDILQFGSGNIGATNVYRALGKWLGLLVFLLDVSKGMVPAAIAYSVTSSQGAAFSVGMAAVVGHCLSPFLKFKGGKGVATSAGALLALTPVATLIGVAIWIIVFWLTRYVSLASITAAIVLPIVILVVSSRDQNKGKLLVYASACVAVVVIWRHRSNVSRLMRGTEPRFTRK